MEKESISNSTDVGKIFSDREPVFIRWVVSLAMAANDLSFLANNIKSAQVDHEKFYFFRLASAHLREIAKVIGESRQDEIIATYISKLDNEAKTTYKKIEKRLGSYDNQSLVKNILKVPRDEIFHYPNIKGDFWPSLSEEVKSLDKILVEFSQNDKTILGTRYKFIDVLISQRINKGLSKDLVGQLSAVTVDVISFVDSIFEYLVKIHKKALDKKGTVLS